MVPPFALFDSTTTPTAAPPGKQCEEWHLCRRSCIAQLNGALRPSLAGVDHSLDVDKRRFLQPCAKQVVGLDQDFTEDAGVPITNGRAEETLAGFETPFDGLKDLQKGDRLRRPSEDEATTGSPHRAQELDLDEPLKHLGEVRLRYLETIGDLTRCDRSILALGKVSKSVHGQRGGFRDL